jgi:DNA polymerase-3 subunit epsilon
MPDEAFSVHGIGPDLLDTPRPPRPGEVTLKDKPVFRDVAHAFVEFIGDAKLVIHNAAFDMKFLNAELGWLRLPQLPWAQAIDTLAIARQKFPGSPASLDALCRRFVIDNTARTLHGALLDSEILAEVYLELIGGRQPDLVLSSGHAADHPGQSVDACWRTAPRPQPLPSRLSEDESTSHRAFVERMGDAAIWSR